MTDAQRARETVLRFGAENLGEKAVERLSSPLEHYEETFALLDVDPESEDDLGADVWGQILIEEMLEWSRRALWLDWKYNVLTMIQDDDWDDQLGKVFAMNGVALPTTEERSRVLAKVQEMHGDQAPQALMWQELQPIADARGFQLMIFENESDGVAFFMLPKDKAGEWHLTHLGHVLIIEAVNGEVADPRANGKLVRLTS